MTIMLAAAVSLLRTRALRDFANPLRLGVIALTGAAMGEIRAATHRQRCGRSRGPGGALVVSPILEREERGPPVLVPVLVHLERSVGFGEILRGIPAHVHARLLEHGDTAPDPSPCDVVPPVLVGSPVAASVRAWAVVDGPCSVMVRHLAQPACLRLRFTSSPRSGGRSASAGWR
jgi:hypothetical protein